MSATIDREGDRYARHESSLVLWMASRAKAVAVSLVSARSLFLSTAPLHIVGDDGKDKVKHPWEDTTHRIDGLSG
jgi:hypothetical protein